MRKYISKIAIIFMMAFVIGIGYGVSAKAADDGVVGTHNLNNTAENSAKVGDQLKEPEKGWKRYDDRNSNINCVGEDNQPLQSRELNGEESYKQWSNGIVAKEQVTHIFDITSDGEYNNTRSVFKIKDNEKIHFAFTGAKLRILGFVDQSAYSNKVGIKIDGVSQEYSLTFPYSIAPNMERSSRLVYEIKNLKKITHNVEITSLDGKIISLDAVDIDENGELKPYAKVNDQSITLDKNSLNLLPGKSEKLTATVTPDNIKDKKIIWSSSDKSIAAVDENGNVRALKEGEAIITATVEGTDLKAECKVNVTKKDVPVEPSQGDAVLTITMTNGNIKSYNVTMEKVNDFIKWYEGRANGSNGYPFYKFDKPVDGQDFKSKTEYIIFDKISSFEVDEK